LLRCEGCRRQAPARSVSLERKTEILRFAKEVPQHLLLAGGGHQVGGGHRADYECVGVPGDEGADLEACREACLAAVLLGDLVHLGLLLVAEVGSDVEIGATEVNRASVYYASDIRFESAEDVFRPGVRESSGLGR